MSNLSGTIRPAYGLAGSSAARCLEDLEAAREAVSKALDLIRHTAPNGRDFIGRPADLDAATEQFAQQRRDLDRIANELLQQAIWASDNVR